MIKARWHRTFGLALLLLAGSSFSFCRADAAADKAARIEAARQVAEITKQAKASRKDNPAQAIAQIQKFQAEHATADPRILASLDLLIAQIYAVNLKDSDKALAAIETGLPRTQLAWAYLPLIEYKAQLLGQAGKHDQARALFQQELPRLLSESAAGFKYLRSFLSKYVASARRAGQMEAYAADMRAILAQHPELVTSVYIGPAIVESLLDRPGQEAEALSWAKLYWQLCEFDEKALTPATALLQKAWIARDGNAAQSTAFLTAMQDATAPNPLQEIPLPGLDKAKIRALMEALGPSATHTRIKLLVMLGENEQAMLGARRMLLDNPTSKPERAALEIAWVFKAIDLNLVRANAYLKYFQSGQGENPLDEFLQQKPVAAPVAAK